MSAERIKKRFIKWAIIWYVVAFFVYRYIEYPLHRAARWNAPTIAEVLIANGADVNRNTRRWGSRKLVGIILGDDRNGPTSPLHEAAVNNAKETAEVLLANGAHVYLINDYGWSALHWAAKVNAKETAEVLLAHGANVRARTDRDNWTAWDVAVKSGSKDVAELLLKHRAK